MQTELDWEKEHILKINRNLSNPEIPNPDELRDTIEPWLSAIFQSDHLSLLIGTGLTAAVTNISGTSSQGMTGVRFEYFGEEINKWAENRAKEMGRTEANIEDVIRSALELLNGLQIQGKHDEAKELKKEINLRLLEFIQNILKAENEFINGATDKKLKALKYLKSFLISFASRMAPRDRLNIFTTNYDRFIEYGCDQTGIMTLDRFIGKIEPILRTTKLELDYHYNPPGIRGEPRYVEGVVRLTKLHGSIDWRFKDGEIVRSPLPFGADDNHPGIPPEPKDHVVIYPNSSKGIETAFYPYSELFRDFSSAVCRPNSAIIIYGYGFGDSHINHILADMLTIPSTHIVIISRDSASGRIKKFVEHNRSAQFTLLIGNHFGDLETLINNYLPRAAIDRTPERAQKIKENRGITGKDRKADARKDAVQEDGEEESDGSK